MRIAIVGGGTAGPAAGILLQRAGHRVTLFERTPNPGPVGAGLLLQPTGLAVLEKLGLRDEVESKGARVERLRGWATSGRLVMNLGYRDLRDDLYGVGVHRGDLFSTLWRTLQKSGATVVCGHTIQHVDDQRILHDETGRTRGPFDLVIAADGARSRVRTGLQMRKGLRLVRRDRAYDWSALWFIGQGQVADELWQVYRGTRKLVGLLPTGGGRVSLFWSLRASQYQAWRDAGLEAWKREVRSMTDRADDLLDQIEDESQVVHAIYRDVVMKRRHDDGLVFVGDAAHAMSPQLGQGANLALVDAWDLSLRLDDLDAFERARRGQTAFYQRTSRWLLPLFQSRQIYLGPLRDWFIPWLVRIPAFRRQSLLAMAGYKDGLFSSCMPRDGD